jgi:hypothetical protein
MTVVTLPRIECPECGSMSLVFTGRTICDETEEWDENGDLVHGDTGGCHGWIGVVDHKCQDCGNEWIEGIDFFTALRRLNELFSDLELVVREAEVYNAKWIRLLFRKLPGHSEDIESALAHKEAIERALGFVNLFRETFVEKEEAPF